MSKKREVIIIKIKTISAHIEPSVESELKHQNREIICDNVDYTRIKDNVNFIYSGGINKDGKHNLSLEESYHLIFDESFQTFQNKQRPCRRSECDTYLEHIRKQKETEKMKGKRNKSATPNELYSIIFQIGDKDSCGYANNQEDFEKANIILQRVAEKIKSLPYVVELTEDDKDNFQKPDLPAFLVLQNCNIHVDENSPHLNLSLYTVSANNTRGQEISNNASKCWEKLGFPTEYTETTEIKRDKNRNDILDKNGQPEYKKVLTKKGVIDWLEFVKHEIIEPEMAKEGWYRAEKIPEDFNHLSIQEYKIAKKKEEIEALNTLIDDKKIEKAISEVNSTLAFNNSENEYYKNYNSTDRTAEFEEYFAISEDFWHWYKKQKEIVLEEIKEVQDEKTYLDTKIRHYNNILINSAPLLTKMLNFIFKHLYMSKKRVYQKKIDELISGRDKLKDVSKEFASNSYKVREQLKDKTRTPDADLLISLLDLEATLKNDYSKIRHREEISQQK